MDLERRSRDILWSIAHQTLSFVRDHTRDATIRTSMSDALTFMDRHDRDPAARQIYDGFPASNPSAQIDIENILRLVLSASIGDERCAQFMDAFTNIRIDALGLTIEDLQRACESLRGRNGSAGN